MPADTIFFDRVIGNTTNINSKTKEEINELRKTPDSDDGLWIQNYPY
jgi:hypothetical protein